MADVDCLSPEVTSHHFMSSYTQVGVTSNDVTSSPAKIVYMAENLIKSDKNLGCQRIFGYSNIRIPFEYLNTISEFEYSLFFILFPPISVQFVF